MGTLRPISLVSFPLAILSLFIFPWEVTLLLMTAAALSVPPSAILVGVLADILYYPGIGLPAGVLWGAALYIAASGVRHIVKTRIL